jgi:hypothetical protein
MSEPNSSSRFTTPASPFGPPLIGALLRMPLEAVQERMLERLHAEGFADFDASYLTVFRYPGPHGARPSELAGQLERRGYLEREADRDDGRSKRIALTRRGTKAVGVIRDAVAEMEAGWEQQLGSRRFAQLRLLLQELNQPG